MLFLFICNLALILLVWFRTEAWLEYARLLHLKALSFYEDFDEKKKMDVTLTYHLYLRMYHNNFFVRLVTCPICLAVWVGSIFSIFFIPLQAPVIIIGGLLLFSIIDRLLG